MRNHKEWIIAIGEVKDYYGKGADQIVFGKKSQAIPNHKPDWRYNGNGLLEQGMTQKKLINIIMGLLDTDLDLGFFLQLKKDDLETLVACIRDRVGQI